MNKQFKLSLLVLVTGLVTACGSGSKSVSNPAKSVSNSISSTAKNVSNTANPTQLQASGAEANKNTADQDLEHINGKKWRVDFNSSIKPFMYGRVEKAPWLGAALTAGKSDYFKLEGNKFVEKKLPDLELYRYEINPTKVQHYELKQDKDDVKINFVNQKYSSYLSWDNITYNDFLKSSGKGITVYERSGVNAIAKNQPRVNGNLATDSKFIESKQTATYKGFALHKGETLGRLELIANFADETVQGKIDLIDERQKDLILHKSGLNKVPNLSGSGVGVIFHGSVSLEGESPDKDASYGGVFVGPNAEEVIGGGSLNKDSSEFLEFGDFSFGGTRE